MGRSRLPREVLARARAEASRVEAKAPAQEQAPARPTTADATPRASVQGKREKIVRALRKLHPMD
ncbi:MAG: hypothetical protein RL653_4042 [Pseudomonadota bacterium]|jgi:hypothetical protein